MRKFIWVALLLTLAGALTMEVIRLAMKIFAVIALMLAVGCGPTTKKYYITNGVTTPWPDVSVVVTNTVIVNCDDDDKNDHDGKK